MSVSPKAKGDLFLPSCSVMKQSLYNSQTYIFVTFNSQRPIKHYIIHGKVPIVKISTIKYKL